MLITARDLRAAAAANAALMTFAGADEATRAPAGDDPFAAPAAAAGHAAPDDRPSPGRELAA